MAWVYIVVFVVALVLSIALAPKPPERRSAALDDFQVPTADEGRAIPVVFGAAWLRGPNVLWYGRLSMKPIRKRSGFSKTTIGYDYFLAQHLGMCHGPINSVVGVEVGEKTISGGVFGTFPITGNTTRTVALLELFGGQTREGGIGGVVDFMFGGPAQTANPYLQSVHGPEAIPAFRGIFSVVLRGGAAGGGMYVGTTPYLKPWAFLVNRSTAGWHEDTCWYPEKVSPPASPGGMNAAHIIYQVLTDPRWGMGVDVLNIDDSSFRAAADTLYDEGFGLCMAWNQQATIEQFLTIVCNHIAGAVALDLSTGRYQLKLIRGDYDPDTLDTFGPSQIIQLKDYQRNGWGEIVNEVTLVYSNPSGLKRTSITQHDIGNIDSQAQARVPTSVELPGIASHALATTVLSREVASRTTPLAKVSFEVNRAAWPVSFGGLFKLNWSEPGIEIQGVVFRVLKISKGTLQRNSISIEALQDIYALGVGAVVAIPAEPTAPAEPATPVESDDPGVVSTTTTTPPSTPDPGDTYFVPDGATDDWAGHEGETAEWDEESGEWVFTPVPDHTIMYDEALGQYVEVIDGVAGPAPWAPAIPPLVEDTAPADDDMALVYDVSGAAYRKVKISRIGGGRQVIQLACSDLVSDLTAGAGKAYIRVPRAMTIGSVRASLLVASASGLVTVDINNNGSSILSTKLTIDAGEKTSVTAATAPVLASPALADDDELTIDIDTAGTGARGLIVSILSA